MKDKISEFEERVKKPKMKASTAKKTPKKLPDLAQTTQKKNPQKKPPAKAVENPQKVNEIRNFFEKLEKGGGKSKNRQSRKLSSSLLKKHTLKINKMAETWRKLIKL